MGVRVMPPAGGKQAYCRPGLGVVAASLAPTFLECIHRHLAASEEDMVAFVLSSTTISETNFGGVARAAQPPLDGELLHTRADHPANYMLCAKSKV